MIALEKQEESGFCRREMDMLPVCDGVCHPSLDAAIHTPRKSASQAVLCSRRQVTLHATRRTPHGGASRLMLPAMSVFLVGVEPRRALWSHDYGHAW